MVKFKFEDIFPHIYCKRQPNEPNHCYKWQSMDARFL